MTARQNLSPLVLMTLLLVCLSAGSAHAQKFPGWRLLANGNNTLAVAELNDVVWIGTAGSGLVRFDKQTHQMTTYTRLNSLLPDNWVQALAVDSSQRLWIGTRRGLTMIDGDTWSVYDTIGNGYPAPGIGSIAVGRGSDIWAAGGGLSTAGLLRFDGANWHVYSPEDSTFAVNKVTCVATTTDGGVWVGTDQYGIYYFDGVHWEEKGFNTYPELITTLDVASNGDVCAGMWHGNIMRYDGDDWHGRFASNTIHVVKAIDDSSTIAGSADGLLLLKNDSIYTLSADQPHIEIHGLVAAHDGGYWLASNRGLVRYNNGTREVFPTSTSILPTNSSSLLFAEGPAMWMASGENLYRFDENAWTLHNKSNADIPEGEVRSIARDSSGSIWIATTFGLSRFDGTAWHSIHRDSIYGVGTSVGPVH